MKVKVILTLIMTFGISISPVNPQTPTKAENLDKSYRVKLEKLAAGIYSSQGLESANIEKWKTLVRDLYSKGNYDWNSVVKFIENKIKGLTEMEIDFYKMKLTYLIKLKGLIKGYVEYLRNMRAKITDRNFTNFSIKLKNISAASANRNKIADLKLLAGSLPSGESLELQAAQACGLPDSVPPEGCETPDELDALLETWDEELQSIGEDAQLAMVDMQNMLQKQQQAMQMMSQISKMLHDTAMAVIRKMGG